MLIEVVLLLVLVFSIYHWRARSYWRRRNVFSLEGELLFGNTRKLMFGQITFVTFFEDIIKKYKDKKMVGFYNFYEPWLLVADLDLIHRVLVEDFNSFSSVPLFSSKAADPLINMNPFFSQGEEWKHRRGIVTNLLTQAKLKDHLSLMKKNGQVMVEHIMENNTKPIRVNDLTRFYTTDNVTSIMYGLEPNAFRDPENGFRRLAEEGIVDSKSWLTIAVSTFMFPISTLLRLRFISEGTEKFFMESAKRIYNIRKQSSISRNDLFDAAIKQEGKMKTEGKQGLETARIAGSMLTVFVDSVETSSNTMNFLLLELANRQEVQDRLREEIRAFGERPEDFDFDKVHSVVYLNMVFSEIVRLHPLLQFMHRICTQDTKLGGVDVEKGTKVFIPYTNLINNPEYFPDPEKFDPDRFSPDNISPSMKKTFLPFGVGPKQCPGMKYAMLQIKLAVIYLLLNFRLLPLNKTDEQKVPNSKEKSLFIKPDTEEKIIFQKI